jgi:RHH-type proline utilization regulon transcriptional repressor/proline dehydrogenase/delta 1-pyrroline-5-carboxylate dehydrogenase
MPGPTGELNRLTTLPRAPVLCLGPGAAAVADQAAEVRAARAVPVALDGGLPPEALTTIAGIGGVLWWGDDETGKTLRRALAARRGPILPLITGHGDAAIFHIERHLCVDTTASGGNAALLAAVSK